MTARVLALVVLALLLAGCVDHAVPERRLRGGWRLTSLDGRSVEAGASVAFGPGQAVSGEDGCNHFAGTASVHRHSLTVREIAMTLLGCVPIRAITMAMDELLQTSRDITFTVAGAELTLRPPNGPTFGFRR